MNKKRNLLLVVVVAALTLTTWVLVERKKDDAPDDASIVAVPNLKHGNRQSSNSWVSPVPNDPDPEYTRKFLETTDIDPSIEWRAPVNFFGRVLYEDAVSSKSIMCR